MSTRTESNYNLIKSVKQCRTIDKPRTKALSMCVFLSAHFSPSYFISAFCCSLTSLKFKEQKVSQSQSIFSLDLKESKQLKH